MIIALIFALGFFGFGGFGGSELGEDGVGPSGGRWS
jgi:hypothetical protein